MNCIDLANFVEEGKANIPLYSMEYEGYMSFFKYLGFAFKPLQCDNVPSSWAPLIMYLGHDVLNVKPVMLPGWEFEQMDWVGYYMRAVDKRSAMEISCSCRPELINAIFCIDSGEWPCPIKYQEKHMAFTVTNNAGYFRPEVREYQNILEFHVPEKHKALLVPCSADKPYPSRMHSLVIDLLIRLGLRDEWEIIVATGVLGLVPEDLWMYAPYYDSGVPNFSRCSDTVAWYFRKHKYTHLISYSDFYAHAIHAGLGHTDMYTDFVFGYHYRTMYENLMLPEHIDKLQVAILKAQERR